LSICSPFGSYAIARIRRSSYAIAPHTFSNGFDARELKGSNDGWTAENSAIAEHSNACFPRTYAEPSCFSLVLHLHFPDAQREKENHTEKTIQKKNKDLVLRAFDALFNRRDYETAETFWSPKYIQHSAHIEPGREGLFNPVKSIPATLKYEPGLIVAEGDFVIVHGRFSGMGLPVNWIAADILRIENGILVEHWDVIQDEATQEQSKSKAPMFGPSFPIYSKPERTVG
jgi:predicted SnoaL-like aldol condensation-catalyzing enzyme